MTRDAFIDKVVKSASPSMRLALLDFVRRQAGEIYEPDADEESQLRRARQVFEGSAAQLQELIAALGGRVQPRPKAQIPPKDEGPAARSVNRLLTYEQAGEFVGMSPSWIKKQVREGALPVTKLGTASRIQLEALEELIRQHTDRTPR